MKIWGMSLGEFAFYLGVVLLGLAAAGVLFYATLHNGVPGQ